MEHDSNEVLYETNDGPRSPVPHEKEAKGAQESKTLLDSPGLEKPPADNGTISDSDYTSVRFSHRSLDLHYDDCRSPEKYTSRTFDGPIRALMIQLIVLIAMIVFVVWTSTGHRIVPSPLATLFLGHPQSTITVITLFGSLLSLVNMRLFSEAVRFATIVRLGHRSSRRMSLYSLYAITSICSRGILSSSDKWHVHWTIISVICFCLFAAQTSAWTTILTPRTILIPQEDFFQDFDFSRSPSQFDVCEQVSLSTDCSVEKLAVTSQHLQSSWGQMSDSGVAAMMEGLNAAQYLSFFGNTFNGTTRGIMPIRTTFDNGPWISAEAIQQGLSVNVSCEDTLDSDRLVIWNQTMLNPPQVEFQNALTSVSLCCNCTSEYSQGTSFIWDNKQQYLNLVVCPFQWINNTDSVITVYVRHNLSPLGNQTCTIKPQLLNVSVTYNRDGFVTLVPMLQPVPDLPIYTSIMVNATYALKEHFVGAQRISGNNVIDSINLLVNGNIPANEVFRAVLASYIRGVFEYSVTAFRYTWFQEPGSGADTQYYRLTKKLQAVVWGQVPELRLIIIISPSAIMITTIAIFIFSLHKAQNLALDHIASFDPMNPLHVIAACGSGNVQTVAFPSYNKQISSFSKDLEVQLPEYRARNEPAGFQFFRRRY